LAFAAILVSLMVGTAAGVDRVYLSGLQALWLPPSSVPIRQYLPFERRTGSSRAKDEIVTTGPWIVPRFNTTNARALQVQASQWCVVQLVQILSNRSQPPPVSSPANRGGGL